MAVRAVTDVNDDTFGEEVLKNTAPVLVDFWAPWCGPCRMIMPLIDELSVEFSGKLKCVKLNTDESPNVATDYGRRLGDNAIGPTLLSSIARGVPERPSMGIRWALSSWRRCAHYRYIRRPYWDCIVTKFGRKKTIQPMMDGRR